MVIHVEKEKEYLAKDIKFYSPQHNTFCLGRNLEEAADIIRRIKQHRTNISKGKVYK